MIFDLLPSEDQTLIENSVQSLLANLLPVERLREQASHRGKAETAIWQDLADMGLFGMGLPDECGGAGYGIPEEVLVVRQLGIHLASPDVFAQMMAVHLADDPGLRTAFMRGEMLAALAFPSGANDHRVLDGAEASHVVIAGPAPVLAACDPQALATLEAGIDETVGLSALTSLMPVATGTKELGKRMALLLCAYLVGIARATTDMAVEYAKTREQFGQPIGAFQAIKHMCADMEVKTAAAEAQCYYTAMLVASGEEAGREIAMTQLLAKNAAEENARTNIQIHGGMGFTDECDAHRYLKRTHIMTSLARSPVETVARIMDAEFADG